ncbi:MAG: type III pantothenate kinase, partial [Sedimentisphaerales bacterium]|nr:type III pantothenate kinase [Sedimentisphaerales bacterium]
PMDLIAADIGNSRISLAVFVEDERKRTERLDIDKLDNLAETITSLRGLCGPQPLGARTVPVVVSSVNPAAEKILADAVAKALDQNILVVGRDIPLDIKHAVENPEAIGTDRLLTAAAAYAVIQDACVVADFGTAVTIDCVDHYGIFLGGTILPGLKLAARSLHEHTAALPQVCPIVPQDDYGTNTEKAIQHGIYFGAVGALRGIVERYATLLGRWPQVVLTGGDARLIAQHADFVDSLVPDLCLDGIFLTYRTMRQDQDSELQDQLDQFKKRFSLDGPE